MRDASPAGPAHGGEICHMCVKPYATMRTVVRPTDDEPCSLVVSGLSSSGLGGQSSGWPTHVPAGDGNGLTTLPALGHTGHHSHHGTARTPPAASMLKRRVLDARSGSR